MTSPLLALRAAIRARCLPDPGLATLMGGSAKLFDEPPRAELPVYGLFGEAVARDWSCTGGRGHEHELEIVVWGRAGSAASALKAAERLAELLDDAPLALDGHRLVGLAVLAVESGRDPETQLARVTLKLRAATEVAG